MPTLAKFQHTAARRRLVQNRLNIDNHVLFQHTAARRRLGRRKFTPKLKRRFQHTAARRRLGFGRPFGSSWDSCFNTQPPEGGWLPLSKKSLSVTVFQHTAARRRLALVADKIAANFMSFNTQPPEGGWTIFTTAMFRNHVSTHSRPKAAGYFLGSRPRYAVFQHTAARRRLVPL